MIRTTSGQETQIAKK